MRLPRILAAASASAILLVAVLPANGERASSALRAHPAATLDTDGNHSCAVRADGGVLCWGDEMMGRLGYGTGGHVGDDETPATAGTVDLGPRDAVQVATGSGHTCAILDTGDVACWGDAFDGALGYGNTTTIGDDETPAAAGTVNLGGQTAAAITAGGSTTCVITRTGAVMCWGRNDRGQLGHGTVANVGDDETPASVGAVNLGGHRAVAVSAGQSHVCAVLETGSVYCWGAGGNGRLGYGAPDDIGDDETPLSAGPVNLGGMHAVAVTAGGSHTCALGDAGEVRCWGAGADGRLGYGSTADVGDNESVATAGTVNVGAQVVGLSAGTSTTCALTAAGGLRCWGFNATGVHGRGSTTVIGDNEAPAAAGEVTLGGGEARALATGFSHACALRDDGVVWCWGSGGNGRTGQGATATIGDNETLTAGNAAVDLGGPVVADVADLSLGVSPASPTGTVGQDLTVTLTLVNDGPDTAGAPSIAVDLTGAPTLVSAVGTGGFGSGTWSPGTLASGQTATMTLVLRPTSGGTLTITADLDATGAWDPDSTPGNAAPSEDDHAAASVTVSVPPPPPSSDPAPPDPAPTDPAPAEPAPADPAPAPAPRVAPRGLTLDAARGPGGRGVQVTGRLLVPAGARGACTGSVRIAVMTGRRTAATTMAALRMAGTACAYAARLPGRWGTVTVSARFLGNEGLLPRAALSRTLRAR